MGAAWTPLPDRWRDSSTACEMLTKDPPAAWRAGQAAATLMLRGRQASLVRLMPSLCTGMVNTMAVQRCWLAHSCKGSCCTFCGGHSAGSCVQTVLAAVPSSLQTRQGSCRGVSCKACGSPSAAACAQTLLAVAPQQAADTRELDGSCCIF